MARRTRIIGPGFDKEKGLHYVRIFASTFAEKFYVNGAMRPLEDVKCLIYYYGGKLASTYDSYEIDIEPHRIPDYTSVIVWLKPNGIC